MKFRLDITPSEINTGYLLHSETYTASLTNRASAPVQLRYVELATTGGVYHTPPSLPMGIPIGGSWAPSVTVTPDGPLRIDGRLRLDLHFDVDGLVNAKGGYGPMIYNGLIANAYHPEVGRGGYFHENSGTSEGQGVMILACFRAYEVLKDDPAEATVAAYYLDLALSMLDAMSEFDNNGPMLRQPIPENRETITLLHWLFAAKGPVQLQTVVLDREVALSGKQVIVPASALGGGLVVAYKLYPADRELLYPSPFSPVIGGGEVAVSGTTTNPDGSVTISATATNGAYKLAYSYYSPETLPLASAYEAYPVWSAIPDGYAACAPDTFRWFDMALEKAILLGPPRDASKWTKLRDALRRTVVKGQNLSDLREVIKPLKRIGVFDTSGMFCYSDNPNALSPGAGSGLEPGWVGYNFWARDNATGDIVGEVPLATFDTANPANSSTQIGRGFEDTWRGATTYQQADQFLLVEMSVVLNQNISPDAADTPPNFRPFISSTRDYDPATRYYAAVGSSESGDSWGWDDAGAMRTLLFPRAAFKNDAGAVFPLNGTILNFGVDLGARAAIGYTVRLRAMRLLSGASAAWVLSNLSEARKGSKLPYFPGSIPFATNADLNAQEFVGYNGNPFHGYQLPDLWLNLAVEAELEHPLLMADDLPTVNPQNGVIRYEIDMQNVNGSAKPANIALMEQQLLFLRDAADVWYRDHAVRGPFAHTFVLNTPARHNIGSPAPHTWVYTNDDPNTRWSGYQVRVVESLAEVVRRTAGVEYAEDAYTLAKTQCVNWLTWLDSVWPNLSGTPFKGMPTDFRQTGNPVAEYEEVHAPAIILRACVLLKMGSTAHDALCDAVMRRCWDYLELNWQTTGEMAYTWSPDPSRRWWYGFWHAEIIWTLSVMIGEGRDFVAQGIPLATVKQRLVDTQQWLDEHGVLDARQRVEIPVNGLRAEVVGAAPDWNSEYRVIREYKTDIYASGNGEEQRRATRETPRKTLEFMGQFTHQALRDFQTTVSAWQHRDFVAPELTLFTRTRFDAEAGEAFVEVEDKPVWAVVGAMVMLVRNGRHETLFIDSVNGRRIYFTSRLMGDWPAHTKLCHAVSGHLQASFGLSRQTSIAATGLLALDVEPGSEYYPPLFEVPTDEIFPGLYEGPEMFPLTSVPVDAASVYYYDGEEIFLLRNNWGESVSENREWPVVPVDYGFGVVETTWDVEFSTRRSRVTITCHTPERHKYLSGFFDRMRGAQGNFWMPTWENDLPLAADLASEAQTMRVLSSRSVKLLMGNPIYREIAVVTISGQVYTNSILAASYVGDEAVLTLRDPWPDAIPLSEVLMVSWMPAWRLSADQHTFVWLTDEVAQVAFDCQTDKAERYDPADVAASRLAVIYTSLPYPQGFGDTISSDHGITHVGLRDVMKIARYIPEAMGAMHSVTSLVLRDGLKSFSCPPDSLGGSHTVTSVTLEDMTPPPPKQAAVAYAIGSSHSVTDGSLRVKLKTITAPAEALNATHSVTGATLNEP